MKDEWDRGRLDADKMFEGLKAARGQQTAVNRTLSLGRVPMTTAKIILAIDRSGLLGNAIRVVGTTAIYCYGSAAGVMVDAGLTATQDVDCLLDARTQLKMVASAAIEKEA